MIKCFQLCFNFAFKFNLRRYITGVLRGTIDVTLPALKNIGDVSIDGWVSFNTITKHYIFVIEEFLFTNRIMTLTASGALVIGTEESFLYFKVRRCRLTLTNPC